MWTRHDSASGSCNGVENCSWDTYCSTNHQRIQTMIEDIEIEAEIESEVAERRKSPPHSNFWALFYVWSIVALFLAGASGATYWFGFR